MPFSIETDLTGLPSGQIITIYSAYIQQLYNYGLIFEHRDYKWTFADEDAKKIINVINRRGACFF